MGVKRNFIYNSLLTVTGYLFPLLTYPYVSRILGVYNIGICNFVNSVIDYYLLFSTMGVISVGVREIAKCKNDTNYKNTVFSSLFSINIIATIFVVLVLFLSIIMIPKFQQYQNLLYVGILKLIFNAFLIEWYYQGIQNFKYITCRSIVIKLVYVISIFIFIKESDDYVLYFCLTIGVTVLNAIINWNHKNVLFLLKNINIKKYINPVLAFGYNKLMISFFTTFNIIFLGVFVSEIEVGYYTTAIKLYSIIMAFYSALTSALIPKMSLLIADNKMDEVRLMVNKVIDILLAVSLPIIIFSECYSSCIINIIAGKGYEGAIIPFMIVMPMMFTIGIEQIFNQQILMCLNKNKSVMIVSTLSAITSLFLNFLFVKNYKSTGSAICWLVSDIVGLFAVCYYVSKYAKINLPIKRIINYMLYSLPYIVIGILFLVIFDNTYIAMIVASILFLSYFLYLNLYLLRNDSVYTICELVISKLRTKNIKL